MGNMKTLAKEILRWSVIAVSGGCGMWEMIKAGRRGIGTQWSGDWSDVFGFHAPRQVDE